MQLSLHVGEKRRRDEVLIHLVQMHYKRSDYELVRTTFRARGDVLEIMPAYEENLAYRVEFFGDDIERISAIDPLTGGVKKRVDKITIFPGSHHVTPAEVRWKAIDSIKEELKERVAYFDKEKKYIEHQRIQERTKYDLEMLREIGTCKGIENYSRHFSGRKAGDPPPCLLDYFPKDYLLFVDESHQTLPQVHAMFNGDRARKNSLVEFGFRLPSAYDNRPQQFEEFYQRLHQVIYVSATPSPWEVQEADGEIVQQVIRPTGLLDPVIEIRPAATQVDDALEEIRKTIEKKHRVLVTTLTKKLAEDLTKYLTEIGIKARYLHSDIETLERVQIINELRRGIIDVLVGINLLREGLDLPEVALVTILDADKEGFLRSETALIQTCGRAARNVEGRVIMYADKITKSIEKTLQVTRDRRLVQQAYNELHHITPTSIQRLTCEDLAATFGEVVQTLKEEGEKVPAHLTREEIIDKISFYEQEMKQAARDLRFEDAAHFRDLLKHYQELLLM
jgi:excinuclease ABC subunit B